MDAGDWIAAVAALIAAGAMAVAIIQAREAKEARHAAQAQAAVAKDAAEIAEAGVVHARRSAKAAEESAAEARKANEFAQRKDERELAERETAAIAEASKIRVERHGGGGLWIHIENHSDQQVFDLVLEEVIANEDPSWRWKFNPRVMGLRKVAPVLYPGDKKRWPIMFTLASGEERTMVGQRYDVIFSFTDSNDQRWRRRNADVPQQVDRDDASRGEAKKERPSN